ncbi:surface lipoprotein assembly modifier [Desulfobacter curvatus]|uniref:surface lipoprotein assembly modifier n=1 Tax=Desulfobacter curvatus TaxID=2290 RepID=UPI000380B5FA|nr:tetratricopeptide repeat protein [Desulfobacter curvatus]
MKKLYLVAVVFLFCRAVALGQDGSGPGSVAQGIALFKSGQFEQAYQMLFDLSDRAPNDPELNFYLGRAAFESGHFEMAIMVFERILIYSPGHDRIKLELARAFYAIGDNNSARRYCRQVLAGDPPETVKENIKAFMARIDKSEQTHFFHGSVTAGMDWNNNVWSSPSSQTIDTVIGDVTLTGPSAQETEDWFFYTALSLDHAYRFLGSPWAWKTDGSFFTGWYDKTHALDIRYAEILTGPQHISGRRKLGFKLLTRQIGLDDERYMDSMGARATMDYVFSPSVMVRTGATLEQKNYPDFSAMDSNNLSLHTDLVFLKFNTWFDMGVGLEHEDADDDEYGYKRFRLNFAASRFLFNRTNGYFRYEFRVTNYDEPGYLFEDRRKDTRHTLSLGLSRKLWQRAGRPDQYFELRLNYQRIWAFSNQDLYEYTQDLVQTCLVYNF